MASLDFQTTNLTSRLLGGYSLESSGMENPTILLGLIIGASWIVVFHIAGRLYRLLARKRLSSYQSSTSEAARSKADKSKDISSSPSYVDVFPPCIKNELEGKAGESDSNTVPKKLIPLDVHYRDADHDACTATGLSAADIQALGNFPDYASISGTPLPEPYPEFDIKKALARPYRPMRWAYHQTMSLTKLQPDWWLELENTYPDRIKQRQDLHAKLGTDVMNQLPGSELATKELLEHIIQFLCARYPHYFTLSADKSTFTNHILRTTTALPATDPLRVILDNVPEDFALMLRDPATGEYIFRAGVICSSVGWNLGQKFGPPLTAIHAPVPDFKEKMAFSMDRYFAKMPVCAPIQRGSWGFELDQPLYHGPDMEFKTFEGVRIAEDGDEGCVSMEEAAERVHFRVDWQTLRRLPLSGAIVFNFKALFTPLTQMRKEPYIPGLALHIIREGKKNILKYKGTHRSDMVVIPVLEEYVREQVEKGLVEKDWEVRTLEESPFFPGWEQLWRADQGF